jgi:hypothetical protein
MFLIGTCTNFAFTQEQATSTISVKITSHNTGQRVPVGELSISGTSTDNATADCTVYADWNDQKPFQKAVATGPGGVNDYSTWTFTYTQNYHLITNGTNNLTSKLSCLSNPTNLTKWNSININGIITAKNQAQQSVIADNITSSGNNTIDIVSFPLNPQADTQIVSERAHILEPHEKEIEDESEEDKVKEVYENVPFKLPFS